MPQFRAKARAVDLLGKGQIADLPTAISELWKNGYDAYGDNLQSFLYLPEAIKTTKPIFVLSDDGKGMSKEDIMNKWFVLGTDSKSRNERDEKGEETLFKEPRIKMGEKGIGRLAVAYLGPQMLMLTKKRKNHLEAVFFDWRILENFNLFLEDIYIPNKTISNESAVKTIFNDLKKEFLSNFEHTSAIGDDPWKDQQDLRQKIIAECNDLNLPDIIIDQQIEDLKSDPINANSTRFIIFNPEEQILELKDAFKVDQHSDAKDINTNRHTVSAINAIFNLFTTKTPEHTTAFYIITENGRFDLLKSREFFEPNDFEICDHLIEGDFDDLGTFNGSVRIYNKKINHTFSLVKEPKKANYGPFSIKLGYVAGSKEESLLNDEQWRFLGDKLDFYGGLYIYRDGFRVLPYGRADNDFLEFEERRGKHAGEWFFAKRRMFGYISISRETNNKLVDKSSREGFVNNAAYRDFKSNLIAFFKDLAKKYFGTNAEYDYKKVQQAELEQLAQAELQERQRDIQARKEFAKNLKQYPQILDTLETEYNRLIDLLQDKIHQSSFQYQEIKSLLKEIDQCKIKIQSFKISKPVRYKPTALQEKNLHAYNKQYSGFKKLIQSSESIIEDIQGKLKVQELFEEFEAKYNLYNNTIQNEFIEYSKKLDSLIFKLKNSLAEEEQIFSSDFNSKYKDILPKQTDSNEITRSLKLLERIFEDTMERISTRISPYLSHLERLSFDVNEDDLVGYYKIQFEQMKDEWNKTYELAQLGIAVEIIDHQFNVLYSQLADNIESLEDSLKNDVTAARKYKLLKNVFTHLEDNYKLLQPLYRTTGRVRKDLTGEELYEYANDFFETRFRDGQIAFEITPSARKWKEFTFESILKPALINIINNAIYWLQPVKERIIRIDSKDDKLLILNSGLPIDEIRLSDIFELFYSERPKGRGIGLYLAKRSLNGIGFDVYASNDESLNLLNGACFIIANTQKK